jgi:hypothetical protein
MDAGIATKAIQDVLGRIQSSQKLTCPELVDTLTPIKDLEKFDSPMSLLTTGMIARKLGITIKPKTNVFGDKGGLFTIKKIVELLCKLSDEQKKQEPATV